MKPQITFTESSIYLKKKWNVWNEKRNRDRTKP